MAALTLTHPDGQVFTFDAGALCLELILTGGDGRRQRFEVLHQPADFAAWCATSSLDLAGHRVAPDEVAGSTSDLATVRRLREALWSAAVGAATGDDPGPVPLTVVNELARWPGVIPQVDPATGAAYWLAPVTAGQLIAEFARDAAAVFSAPTVNRIRQCAGPRCALMYLDTSRPGQRRWCSMQRCGNRNKIQEYRARR
jgi:predicted RNA-binding Zn ribbon-like protein